ncbi:unnamed protein product [Ixodes pacificus]
MNLIQEGSYVVIRGANNVRLVQVDKKKPIFFGKRKFGVQAAIGQPFGSVFEIRDRDLQKVSAEEFRRTSSECIPQVDDVLTSGQDNRNLLDDGKSQKLTREQIEGFKADGTSGEEIVKTLLENSTTFRKKTEYSQQKYLKKKQQKYLQHLTLERPTARLLGEMYYSQNPLKVGNMRVDALAQLLTWCNVRSGGRYAVFDSWLGLLTAAVLERLGKEGSIVQLYPGLGPDSSYRQAVNALNLDDNFVHSTVLELPFQRALDLLREPSTTEDGDGDSSMAVAADQPETPAAGSGNDAPSDGQPSGKEWKDDERTRRRARRLEEQQKAADLLKTKALDGLLVAGKQHPTPVVLTLLEFLAPSRPFAVFCTYQEPLVDLYGRLKSANNAVFLKLSESWLRAHQVLPDRTHPSINMSGGGGYLLTGIKVDNST